MQNSPAQSRFLSVRGLDARGQVGSSTCVSSLVLGTRAHGCLAQDSREGGGRPAGPRTPASRSTQKAKRSFFAKLMPARDLVLFLELLGI